MGVTIHWRPDWPSGSNAALLAKQRRCSTGASAIGGAATGPTLAGVRVVERAAKRAGEDAGSAAFLDAAVMKALRQVLEIGGVLPPDAGLSRMTGLSIGLVRGALERLRRREVIAIETRGTKRAIRLVTEGVVLRTAAAPIAAEAA